MNRSSKESIKWPNEPGLLRIIRKIYTQYLRSKMSVKVNIALGWERTSAQAMNGEKVDNVKMSPSTLRIKILWNTLATSMDKKESKL